MIEEQAWQAICTFLFNDHLNDQNDEFEQMKNYILKILMLLFKQVGIVQTSANKFHLSHKQKQFIQMLIQYIFKKDKFLNKVQSYNLKVYHKQLQHLYLNDKTFLRDQLVGTTIELYQFLLEYKVIHL